MTKFICIKSIIDSIDSSWLPSWGFERPSNNDVKYNVGDIIDVDEKTMWINGDSTKDFLKIFKHLKSLEMKDYFIPYEPIRIAQERDRKIDEILND